MSASLVGLHAKVVGDHRLGMARASRSGAAELRRCSPALASEGMSGEMEQPSPEIVEWAKALINEPLSEGLTAELVELMCRSSPERAAMAAWTLGFGELPEQLRSSTVESLIDVLQDATRPQLVRGHAAEAIGEQLEFSDQSEPARLRAEVVFVDMLDDTSAMVRFWSAFGLGKLRTQSAVPRLRELADDTAVVPGWWTVGEEAADAIDHIEGRQSPERHMDGGLAK